jgi:XTP/dITP diphosphohydrolase
MRTREVKEHNVSAYFPKGKVIFFATGNFHKFNEARRVLAGFKIVTAMVRVEAIEIQDDDIGNIAKASATDALKKTGLPLIVEDAGLFIEALNGFPGPYSSYVYQTLGTKGILKLMEKIEKRDASFHSVVAFCSPKENSRTFHGEVRGKISLQERGSHGFGFDPIFEPSNNGYKTFAEMSIQEKNKFSHRAQALRGFAKWYLPMRRRMF